MADAEILWPLRAVSKDPANLTKLDADNNVLTSTTDLDARYVLKDGDTMTGDLEAPNAKFDVATIEGVLAGVVEAGDVTADRINLNNSLEVRGELKVGYSTIDDDGNGDEFPGSFSMFGDSRFLGPVEIDNFVTSDKATLAVIPSSQGSRTGIEIVVGGGRTALLINGGSTFPSDAGYVINSGNLVKSYHRGRLGLNVVNPAIGNQLEVSGKTVLRGELDVVGNITSTGTAHSFAPNSIPSSAVFGNTPRTISADDTDPDNAGQMIWDSSFLYLHTGATGWKKVALTAL
jgi:hypothetical protein